VASNKAVAAIPGPLAQSPNRQIAAIVASNGFPSDGGTGGDFLLRLFTTTVLAATFPVDRPPNLTSTTARGSLRFRFFNLSLHYSLALPSWPCGAVHLDKRASPDPMDQTNVSIFCGKRLADTWRPR
jgi:hypothetical protein